MADLSRPRFKSARELLGEVFERDFADPEEFDASVVALVKEHLGPTTLVSKAGAKLADALLELARQRAAVSKE